MAVRFTPEAHDEESYRDIKVIPATDTKGEKRIVLSRLRVSQSEQRVLFEREKGAEFMPYMASQVLIKHIDSKQFAIDTYQ